MLQVYGKEIGVKKRGGNFTREEKKRKFINQCVNQKTRIAFPEENSVLRKPEDHQRQQWAWTQGNFGWERSTLSYLAQTKHTCPQGSFVIE